MILHSPLTFHRKALCMRQMPWKLVIFGLTVKIKTLKLLVVVGCRDMEKHSLLMLSVFNNLNSILVYFICVALNILSDFIVICSLFSTHANIRLIIQPSYTVSHKLVTTGVSCLQKFTISAVWSHIIMTGLLATF